MIKMPKTKDIIPDTNKREVIPIVGIRYPYIKSFGSPIFKRILIIESPNVGKPKFWMQKVMTKALKVLIINAIIGIKTIKIM